METNEHGSELTRLGPSEVEIVTRRTRISLSAAIVGTVMASKDFHIYINSALAGPNAPGQRLSYNSIDTCYSLPIVLS